MLFRLATFAAAIIISAPAFASDFNTMGSSSTMFYMAVPLDAGLQKKDQAPYFGFIMQGSRPYETINISTRMFDDNKRFGFLPLGGLEAKWLIVGAVGVAAAVAVGSKDKSRTEQHQAAQQQQAAEQQQMQEECPVLC
jgi:hypothetical protein